MTDLEELLPVERSYDYRKAIDDPPLWLPYQQGDVFADSPRADGSSGLVLLFMHPCTMRRGSAMRERLTVIDVDVFSARKVVSSPSKWADNFKNHPLPDLYGNGIGTWVANFLEIGTVQLADLGRAKRVATLSEAGRLQLQQRFICHLTRFAPETEILRDAISDVEAELANQADWVEAACDSQGFSMVDVEAAELRFGEYLDAEPAWAESVNRPGFSRRALLSGEHRARVTRDIQRAIAQGAPAA